MKQRPKVPKPARDLRAAIRRQPKVFAVYLVLRLIVLATLVSSILRGEYENAFICLLVLALFVLPFFIQQNFGIELPDTLQIIILLFIFASEILGELACFFITIPNWDSILHTTTGFLCAATGFALIDILNRNSKIKFELSPIYVALAAFCFSMTVGVLWEALPRILSAGLTMTIPLTLISFSLAMVIAVAVALVQYAHVPVLSQIARFYIWVVRGTPLLVQLFIIFYGLPSVGIMLDAFPAAVIAFAFNEGA